MQYDLRCGTWYAQSVCMCGYTSEQHLKFKRTICLKISQAYKHSAYSIIFIFISVYI